MTIDERRVAASLRAILAVIDEPVDSLAIYRLRHLIAQADRGRMTIEERREADAAIALYHPRESTRV